MNTETPLVSVRMITYNHEKFIAQAIEGVLMQKTNFPFELIIGEDCSTDRTREVVVDYANKYPEIIKPILHEKNVGAKANSKAVREACVGKYIAICEGDDYWIDSLKLQKQVDFMENHPDFSMCCHAVSRVNVKGRDLKKPIMPYREDRVVPTEDVIVAGGGFVGTNSILYRKEFMENPPEFYRISPVGDAALLLNLAIQGKVYYFADVMSAYRTGASGSWTCRISSSREKRADFNLAMIEMLKLFDDCTCYKYADSIDAIKLKHEFDLYITNGEFDKLNQDRYASYTTSLDQLYILRNRLLIRFPLLFRFARKLKAQWLKLLDIFS